MSLKIWEGGSSAEPGRPSRKARQISSFPLPPSARFARYHYNFNQFASFHPTTNPLHLPSPISSSNRQRRTTTATPGDIHRKPTAATPLFAIKRFSAFLRHCRGFQVGECRWTRVSSTTTAGRRVVATRHSENDHPIPLFSTDIESHLSSAPS